MPAETIVKKCATRLTVAQLAHLHDRGVSDSVIDLHATELPRSRPPGQNLADWNTREMWGDHFW